ncbi:MAG: hypothetical protein ABDH21_06775 [bacterium]
MLKIPKCFISTVIILVLQISQFCLSSELRLGYEVDMRPKNLNVRQNIFIDYKLSERYRMRMIFNDIDMDKDLFTDKLDVRFRLYYIPSKGKQWFFTLGSNLKTLGYSHRIKDTEYELVGARRKQRLEVDAAIRLHLSQFFTLKLGFVNILSPRREFYIRPRFVFLIK